ncbi:alkaline phosphatase [Desulfocicer niacini]
MQRKINFRFLYVLISFICLSGLYGGHAAASELKYVFLFIGDGMGISQRVAAGQFAGKPLLMDSFPGQGITTTCAANQFITRSAAAATAISCGEKTRLGILGLDIHHSPLKTIAERARDQGRKVGIITSVSIDHATPAAFYAHVPSRKQYYDIALALARSDFNYFAGGGFRDPENKYGKSLDFKGNALDVIRKAGYGLVNTREAFNALSPGADKVIVMNRQSGHGHSLPYAMDADDTDISLAEFTRKGIELLKGEKGFFMMVEGGQIDFACHANDAAAAIGDTIAFDAAINEAFVFLQKHPLETLIVVTTDHECGGMSLGFAGTHYDMDFTLLHHQKMSSRRFEKKIVMPLRAMGEKPSFEEMKPIITKYFGLRFAEDIIIPLRTMEKKPSFEEMEPIITKFFGLGFAEDISAVEQMEPLAKKYLGLHFEGDDSDIMHLKPSEVEQLRDAYKISVHGEATPSEAYAFYLRYGGNDPLSITLTHLLNQKAGIAWGSYSHTGTPVITSATGVGYEQFLGMYDNAELGKKLMSLMGMTK